MQKGVARPKLRIQRRRTPKEGDASGDRGQLGEDGLGDLFGTTAAGGASGNGTVFEVAKTATGYSSTPTTLVSFNGANGRDPQGPLAANALGDLFGTTAFGGTTNQGTVFELTGSGFAAIGKEGHFQGPALTLSEFGSVAGGWTSQDKFPRLLADVNGDGRADIVGFSSNGVIVSLSQGNGQFAAPQFSVAQFGSVADVWTSQDAFPRLLADVNGYGRAPST